MKNLFGWMLVVLLVLTAGVSCSDDEELLAGNGIADAAWSAENQVEIEGCLLYTSFGKRSTQHTATVLEHEIDDFGRHLLGCYDAVSYTHLDVYKRQLYDRRYGGVGPFGSG